MFNNKSREISYIGKFLVQVKRPFYIKSEIYPISTIESINKDVIVALFREEEATIKATLPDAKRYHFSSKFTKETNVHYQIDILDSYDSVVGSMLFEVFEESRLLEITKFLGIKG